MKKIYMILMGLITLSSGISNAQTVHRVNNDERAAAPFTSVQEAINTATAGDIIIIEGSATSYGNISINKQLTLRGPGYYLNENNPVSQANQRPASLSTVTLTSGSDGTILESLSIGNLQSNNNSPKPPIDNIKIRKSLISTFYPYLTSTANLLTNWEVSQSVINQIYAGNISSLLIKNSIITGFNYNYDNAIVSFVNCTFSGTGFSVSYGGENNSNNYTNCIFNRSSDLNINIGLPEASNSISFSHAIIAASSFTLQSGTETTSVSTDNNNQFNVDMSFVFVGQSGNTTDGRWQLANGSAAISAGVDGVDCGAFGGGTPYVLSGIPTAPVITNMSTTGGGTADQPLKVTISATGNQ